MTKLLKYQNESIIIFKNLVESNQLILEVTNMSIYFDDSHSLVNVSNSILKFYSIPCFHPSDTIIDDLLKTTKNKKIVLILLDGFGKAIQEKYRQFCPFIYQHNKTTVTSVFPPTTAAATTSLLNGRYPCETGWVGWTEKFDMYPWPVIMFYDTFDDDSMMKISTSTSELCPYQNIISLMNEKGLKADMIQSFTYKEDSIKDYFSRVDKMIPSLDFLYVYHCSPDSELHRYGVGAIELNDVIKSFDEEVKNLVDKHKDTLFILLADHGHMNTTYFSIEEHDDFYSCLKMKTYAIESRCAAFFVYEDKKDDFIKAYKRYYEPHFDLYTKGDVINKKLFGYGLNNPHLYETIGDFVLVSKDGSAFTRENGHKLVSTHAGGTKEEREINVSFYNL